MSKFQLIFTGIFGAFILLGVLIFAFSRGSSEATAKITVWGTMSQNLFTDYLKETAINKDKRFDITYVEKRRETFDQDFIEALASGTGPDLFFLQQDSVLKHEDKIYTIPFDSYPERAFKSTFIEEGELFLTSKGVIAIPFIIDPMVMYWNRDTFSNAGISVPPKLWSEFYDLATKLTNKDANFNVTKSAFALGEYGNVTNANELVSLLIMQAGNPITVRETGTDNIYNLFNQNLNLPFTPAEQALNFYTEFSNPLKPFYSWNRSLPESKKFFLSGDLAMYFGFASELADIRLKNPNLNFDIARMPQSKDAPRVTTFGRMVSLAITKNSKNVGAAFQVAALLTGPENLEILSKLTNLPPVRRDLLAVKPTESFLSLFYDAAIQSKGWLSPESSKLNPIFREMVESITAGRANVSQVLTKTSSQLDTALTK